MAKKTTTPSVEVEVTPEPITLSVEVEVTPEPTTVQSTYQVTDEQIDSAINQLLSILTIDTYKRDALVQHLNAMRNA